MQHAELATRLVNSSDANRETLLWENAVLADVELAYKLKDICLEGWSTLPAQALGAAASLQLLSQIRSHPEIKALAAWTAGLRALVGDRKSTRLNSSHSQISYAVFCL